MRTAAVNAELEKAPTTKLSLSPRELSIIEELNHAEESK